MKLYITISIFLFTGLNISQAQVTWLGGSSNWNIAANWDTGTIPTAADEVIIPSGTVYLPGGYQGFATHVEISSGAKLQLRVNSDLLIDGAFNKAGLLNYGVLKVFGALEIQNITQTLGNTIASGITSDHEILVGSNGSIVIHDVDYHGIDITSNSTSKLTNKGSIELENCGEDGLSARGKVFNAGSIDITHPTLANKHAILVHNTFKNYSKGSIHIDGGHEGIATVNASVVIKNWGTIYSNNASQTAIRNNGNFTNYASGTITTENSSSYNLYNSGTFTNIGECYFWGSDFYGVGNFGFFLNQGYINIHQSLLVGFYNFAGATVNNHGNLNFSAGQNIDLGVEGTFINHDDAYLTQRNKFDFRATGVLENYGILKGFGDSAHLTSLGYIFENHGLIDDPYDRFASIADNQQVIISPIADPLQNGVGYSPALTLAAHNNVSFGDWKTSNINGIVCGTYDEATNTFTPNVNAIGLNSIYLTVYIDASSNGTYVEIPLDVPVAAFTGKGPKTAMQFRKKPTAVEVENSMADFNIFPNPTSGPLTILNGDTENEKQIHVTNTLGQVVFQQIFAAGENLFLELPSALTDGFYSINVFQNDQLINSKRVQLIR